MEALVVWAVSLGLVVLVTLLCYGSISGTNLSFSCIATSIVASMVLSKIGVS